MGRTVNEITKSERFNIRITKEDRERLESAHKMYRPRMQFQEFLLECMDYGLEIQEIEYTQQKYIKCLAAETKMSEMFIKKLFERKVNIYLSAEEAVRYGIADIII
jgi:ATP-dependent protease ClpP protease subunit